MFLNAQMDNILIQLQEIVQPVTLLVKNAFTQELQVYVRRVRIRFISHLNLMDNVSLVTLNAQSVQDLPILNAANAQMAIFYI